MNYKINLGFKNTDLYIPCEIHVQGSIHEFDLVAESLELQPFIDWWWDQLEDDDFTDVVEECEGIIIAKFEGSTHLKINKED